MPQKPGSDQNLIALIDIKFVLALVKEAEKSEGRIDEEARRLVARTFEFSLERTIHHTDRSDQIFEKVAKTDAILLGNNRLVATATGFRSQK